MTVYVDDANLPFRGMRMCHLLADTHAELIAMAVRLGLKMAWLQAAGTPREHFDVSLSKKAEALRYGAQPIRYKDAGRLTGQRRDALLRRHAEDLAILEAWEAQEGQGADAGEARHD